MIAPTLTSSRCEKIHCKSSLTVIPKMAPASTYTPTTRLLRKREAARMRQRRCRQRKREAAIISKTRHNDEGLVKTSCDVSSSSSTCSSSSFVTMPKQAEGPVVDNVNRSMKGHPSDYKGSPATNATRSSSTGHGSTVNTSFASDAHHPQDIPRNATQMPTSSPPKFHIHPPGTQHHHRPVVLMSRPYSSAPPPHSHQPPSSHPPQSTQFSHSLHHGVHQPATSHHSHQQYSYPPHHGNQHQAPEPPQHKPYYHSSVPPRHVSAWEPYQPPSHHHHARAQLSQPPPVSSYPTQTSNMPPAPYHYHRPSTSSSQLQPPTHHSSNSSHYQHPHHASGPAPPLPPQQSSVHGLLPTIKHHQYPPYASHHQHQQPPPPQHFHSHSNNYPSPSMSAAMPPSYSQQHPMASSHYPSQNSFPNPPTHGPPCHSYPVRTGDGLRTISRSPSASSLETPQTSKGTLSQIGLEEPKDDRAVHHYNDPHKNRYSDTEVKKKTKNTSLLSTEKAAVVAMLTLKNNSSDDSDEATVASLEHVTANHMRRSFCMEGSYNSSTREDQYPYDAISDMNVRSKSGSAIYSPHVDSQQHYHNQQYPYNSNPVSFTLPSVEATSITSI